MFSRDAFDRDPERQALVRGGREVRVVARSHDRRSGFPHGLLEEADDHASRDAVEMRSGLVGQEHAWSGRERSRDRDVLLLATREAVGAAVTETAEPDPLEPAVRPGVRLREWDSADREPELDVLPRR